MIEGIKPHDPHIFTGAGIQPLPGYEAEAEPIIRRLEQDIGFNRADTPWVMSEFLFETEAEGALDFIRQNISVHVGMSDMHCPTAPDPEVPPTADFPHPFIVGNDPDPTVPTYLLSGCVSDRFLAAWQKYRHVYLELHVWVLRPDRTKDESLFLWTVLDGRRKDPLRLIVQTPKPVIIPVDTTRQYRCVYAQKKRWGG